MKRILPALGVAVACAVTLGAQSTPPQQSSQPQTQSTTSKSKAQKSSMSSKSVTLTGCLREGDTPGTFVLANVDTSSLAGTTGYEHPTTTPPAAGSGTSGSGSGSMSDKTNSVELVGNADLDLKAHVGHKVEISGTMVPQGKDKMKSKSSTAGTTGTATGETTSETSRESRKGDMTNMHRLNVRSLKHISETCSM